MAPINMDELQRYVGETMEISIEDKQGGDQAPKIKKTIRKIKLCPDHTHIRFYFDSMYFLAVPLISNISHSEVSFFASDLESGLTYTFQRV